MRVVRILAAAFAIALLGTAAFAQEASIVGTAADESKAVLPGVTVTATNVATGGLSVEFIPFDGPHTVHPDALDRMAQLLGALLPA